MSGAGFILVINLCVAGLISAAFLLLARHSRRPDAAWFMAASYGLGIAYFLLEALIATAGSSLVLNVVSFSAILGAMALLCAGLAVHYRMPVPGRALWTLLLVSALVCGLLEDLPRTSFWRMMAYQTPYFLMQCIATWIVVAARRKTPSDRALAVLLALSGVQFLTKPFLMVELGGTGATAGDYLRTDYALISQTLGTVFALAVAVMTLILLVQDVLADVTVRSETDSLSGLLNRAGFERHAAEAMEDARMRGLPISVVVADLDHFKSVNDTFGHASGDRVIAAFAGFLRSTAAGSSVAARLGGEEFSIILPGSNLIAARLFAEGARAAFCSLAIDGLPPDRRFTASFGVAQRQEGEPIEALMKRADAALYTAKREGRDCVRVADTNAASTVVALKRLAG